MVALFTVPAVRASAQAFFDLFRIVDFVAVPVDVTRLERLSDAGLDLRQLIGSHTQVLTDPGPPQVVALPDEAGQLAGFVVKEPVAVPPDMTRVTIQVSGEHAVQVIADGRRLREVLDALAITDLQVPDGLDGQTAIVRVPPVVRIEYGNGDRTLIFVQSRSPEITAPTAVDLPRLGEIGLRIAGIDRAEAYSLARAIDWRSTLIVPVPARSATFQQIAVQGTRGLLVESAAPKTMRSLMWSNGGMMYGLTTNIDIQSLLVAAESVS
jgi:hypothetical protein